MKNFLVILIVLLSACGGGGGGGSSSDASNSGANVDSAEALDFSQVSLKITKYENDAMNVAIVAKENQLTPTILNIEIRMDRQGVMYHLGEVDHIDGYGYLTSFRVEDKLPVGTHSGIIIVKACEDVVSSCAKPLKGSPWSIPYSIKVIQGTNLTPLSSVTGLSSWNNYLGDAGHTGYSPTNFEYRNFSRRWRVQQQAFINGAVSLEDGVAYGAWEEIDNNSSTTTWSVKAIRESDGSLLWEKNLGEGQIVNPPTVASGKVFLTIQSGILLLDAKNGQELARQTLRQQNFNYLQPTVYGDSVYTSSGHQNGLSKFSTSSLTFNWETPLGSLYEANGWTPSVDDKYAYVGRDFGFTLIDHRDGKIVAEISGRPFIHSSGTSIPAVGKNGLAFAVQYISDGSFSEPKVEMFLNAFDINKRALKWSVKVDFKGNIVLSENTIFVINGENLEARSLDDGSLLWSFDLKLPIDSYVQRLIVVGSTAFVSTESTYAYDLKTKERVWSYPSGGDLSVSSNGVLYISGSGLTAINLR